MQCVEFARRWWISQLDCYLLNVPRACDIWTRTYVKRLSDNARVALRMHANGESSERPAVHDFLIWKRTDEQPVGHIAIVSRPIPPDPVLAASVAKHERLSGAVAGLPWQVCEVTDEYVCIAEQNVDNNRLWAGGHYSRKFALQRNPEDGAWTIRDDEDPMFGWVRCMRDEVLPTPPFVKPEAARLPVDGVFEGDTYTALQIFVGLDAKRGAASHQTATDLCALFSVRVRL
jgi:hypothetical protein